MDALTTELEAQVTKREEQFESRSEKWKDSEKG